MPRVRFGKVHIVNCLYSSSVTSYCIGAGYKSNIYVEKTVFSSSNAQKRPWKNCATSSKYKDYNITITGCLGASNKQSRSGSNSYFNSYSYYKYSSFDVSKVKSEVSKYAGATLTVSEGDGVSAKQNFLNDETTGISTDNLPSEVAKVHYYNVDGVETSGLTKGVNVVRIIYTDGSVKVKKVMGR
jgi:pectate lyase